MYEAKPMEGIIEVAPLKGIIGTVAMEKVDWAASMNLVTGAIANCKLQFDYIYDYACVNASIFVLLNYMIMCILCIVYAYMIVFTVCWNVFHKLYMLMSTCWYVYLPEYLYVFWVLFTCAYACLH